MVKLGSQSLQQADLQREAKANEQNYLLYLSKREQERTSDALDRTRIENVAIAVPPAIPVLPVHGPTLHPSARLRFSRDRQLGYGLSSSTTLILRSTPRPR